MKRSKKTKRAWNGWMVFGVGDSIDDIVSKWWQAVPKPLHFDELVNVPDSVFADLARAAFNAGLEAGAKVAENPVLVFSEIDVLEMDQRQVARAIAAAIRNLKEQQ